MKQDITTGEKYDPAMKIAEQAEADAYFEECVQHNMAGGTSREDAERIERTNLGYYAGYCSDETRERVERLFRCAHPIFGSIVCDGPRKPGRGTCFICGKKKGQQLEQCNGHYEWWAETVEKK